MSKYTPGPWSFHPMSGDDGDITECGSFDAHTIHVGSGETLICQVEAYDHKGAEYAGFPRTANFEENKANARLIAAAPELLGALQNVCGLMKIRCQDRGGCYERAMRAIAKALGDAS